MTSIGGVVSYGTADLYFSGQTAGSATDTNIEGNTIVKVTGIKLTDSAEQWLDHMADKKYFNMSGYEKGGTGREIACQLIERGLKCLLESKISNLEATLNFTSFKEAIRNQFSVDLLSDTEIQQLFYIATGAGTKEDLTVCEFLFTVFWLGTNRKLVEHHQNNSQFSYKSGIAHCYAFLVLNPYYRSIFKGICTNDQYKDVYLKMSDPFVFNFDVFSYLINVKKEKDYLPSSFLNFTIMNFHRFTDRFIFDLSSFNRVRCSINGEIPPRRRTDAPPKDYLDYIELREAVSKTVLSVEKSMDVPLPSDVPTAPPAPFPSLLHKA